MARATARKERTLPTRSSPPAEVDVATDPGIVFDHPPEGRNESRDDFEPAPGTLRETAHPLGKNESAGDDVKRRADQSTSRLTGVFHTLAKILVWVSIFPVLSILPVVVALRVSVSVYQQNSYDGWVALGIGVLAAMLLVCACIVVFMLSFGIRRRFFMQFVNIWMAAILCYSGYALFYLSNNNAKTEEIRSYYTSLHPLLRVAVRNLTFVDEQFVITDLQRTRADYEVMGLRPRERSMHYRQPTGFVHAVDIRTNGRSKLKNLLVELYFVLMGFDTIRHVGTADHLHVSLSLRESDSLTAASGDKTSCDADC